MLFSLFHPTPSHNINYFCTMDITISNPGFTDRGGPAMFDLLRSTLTFPADVEAKGAKLASDIEFIRNSSQEDLVLNMDIWSIFLYMAQCVPLDHPWQDALLVALTKLRLKGGPISNDTEVRNWLPLALELDLSIHRTTRLLTSTYLSYVCSFGKTGVRKLQLSILRDTY